MLVINPGDVVAFYAALFPAIRIRTGMVCGVSA